MTRIAKVVDIHAPVPAVWDVLTHPANIPALYPDAIAIQAIPPGESVVGQRYTITGKVGRRKVEIFGELTELVPRRRIVTRIKQGPLFKSFGQTIELEQRLSRSEVKLVYDYEVSIGYLGKVLNEILIQRLVKDNINAYAKNLKAFAELVPIAK